MCYNMSVTSIEVRDITDLDAMAKVLCPESRKVLGHLSLHETLMKYLKLHDGNPIVAKLHQCGPQGPVDMVTPNNSEAEACFELFNKQPARCSLPDTFIMCYACLVPHSFLSRTF
jgi:hypothetical protein